MMGSNDIKKMKKIVTGEVIYYKKYTIHLRRNFLFNFTLIMFILHHLYILNKK